MICGKKRMGDEDVCAFSGIGRSLGIGLTRTCIFRGVYHHNQSTDLFCCTSSHERMVRPALTTSFQQRGTALYKLCI